jgi:hypothetical protein
MGKLMGVILAGFATTALALPAGAGADRYYVGHEGGEWVGIHAKGKRVKGSYVRYRQRCRFDDGRVTRRPNISAHLGGPRIEADDRFRDHYEHQWGSDGPRIRWLLAGRIGDARARGRFESFGNYQRDGQATCRGGISEFHASRVSREAFFAPLERWDPGLVGAFERRR